MAWLSQEELRALRTAVQLMVKRTEDAARPSAPAMEAIEEGSREAEADSDLITEEAAAGGAAHAAGADSPSGVIHVANHAEVSAGSLASLYLRCLMCTAQVSLHCACPLITAT